MFLDLQALLSRADLKVKELRQSLDRLTAESEKLEVSFFFSMRVTVCCVDASFLCLLLVSR